MFFNEGRSKIHRNNMDNSSKLIPTDYYLIHYLYLFIHALKLIQFNSTAALDEHICMIYNNLHKRL